MSRQHLRVPLPKITSLQKEHATQVPPPVTSDSPAADAMTYEPVVRLSEGPASSPA